MSNLRNESSYSTEYGTELISSGSPNVPDYWVYRVIMPHQIHERGTNSREMAEAKRMEALGCLDPPEETCEACPEQFLWIISAISDKKGIQMKIDCPPFLNSKIFEYYSGFCEICKKLIEKKSTIIEGIDVSLVDLHVNKVHREMIDNIIWKCEKCNGVFYWKDTFFGHFIRQPNQSDESENTYIRLEHEIFNLLFLPNFVF